MQVTLGTFHKFLQFLVINTRNQFHDKYDKVFLDVLRIFTPLMHNAPNWLDKL